MGLSVHKVLRFQNRVIYKSVNVSYGWGNRLNETVMLKISKKGDKGYQVCSVPFRKLKRLSEDKHRFWFVEGDFLVLRSYS